VSAASVVVAEGPFFDDLRFGDVFPGASGLTLTDGHAATHRAIVGDRLRIGLDHELSRPLTGGDRPLVNPALVWDVAIGQSTVVTHQVVANLFYRGLSFRRAPSLGDTLHTKTHVVGLRRNTSKRGRPATGLAALRITTTDQQDRPVLDFWRCAMLPLRHPNTGFAHADDMAAVGGGGQSTPTFIDSWHLETLHEGHQQPRRTELSVGQRFEVRGGDVVSSAPELARLTLNIARAHHDDASGGSGRLVYGGHTIGVALSRVVRAVPDLVTVLAWEHCNHLGPVAEGDTLTSTVQVDDIRPAGAAQIVVLHSQVRARSTPDSTARPVLDWRFVGLMS